MNPTSTLSEELPALYRVILDLVVELEQSGGRIEASRIRAQVLAAYASGWDASLQRDFEQTRERLQRAIDATREPHRRRLRRP